MRDKLKRSCSMAAAAVLTSSAVFSQCICTVPANAETVKYIALTFDDGPNTTTTGEVLDVLEQYDVKASFFLIGDNINDKSAENVKRAHDMGCEIDNHSKTHSYMSEMSVTDIKAEIDYVNDEVYKITGEYPSFFRPPYISVSDTMYQAIDVPFICGAGCNDWEESVTAEQRAESVISSAKDGQIILMHDAQGNSQTVEALKTIIPTLKDAGYEFVTLNELFEKQGVTPDEDNMYSVVPRSANAPAAPEAVITTTSSAASSSASSSTTAASSYTVPELSIEKKSIPDNAALKMTEAMRLGWNLGNTMDAYDDTGWVNGEMNIETCWNGGFKTTQKMIDTVKAAGFRTVRIPVSWHNHVDEDLNINKEWLDRVQEIVDYAVKDDLYVIINVHHDNSETTMYPDTAHYESSKKYMTAIWEQVSERFKDYDDKLIFETMNEPRLTGHTNEWWIDFNNEDCIDAIKTINKLNQDCVDTIRATGGNNAERYIAVPGYDCSIDGASNQYFEMPQDTADNKIIVAVHAYIPYGFALAEIDDAQSVDTFDINSDTSDIEHVMDTIYDNYVSKGIPSYIGEFACLNKNDNLQSRIDWTAYYQAYAASRGIPCCWWDAPGDMQLLERGTCTWKYPEIVSVLNKYANSQVETSIVTTTPVSTTKPVTTTTTPISDSDKIYGKKGTDGKVTFSKAIGEKAFIEVTPAEDTGFMNGCLGFVPTVDGKSYWVAYQWETKKEAVLTIDMNKPFQVSEIVGTETEAVTDEAVIKAITEKLKKEKSALLQVWYACDKTGKQIDPPDSAAASIEAYVLADNDTTTTAVDTTTTAVQETTASEDSTDKPSTLGDVNGDGKVTVADAVAILQYIGNKDKYPLSEDGIANADVYNKGDGITAKDALVIQKIDAGIYKLSDLPIIENK